MMDDPLICHSSTPDTVIDDNHRKEALIDNHNVRLLLVLLLVVLVSAVLNPLINIKQGLGYNL